MGILASSKNARHYSCSAPQNKILPDYTVSPHMKIAGKKNESLRGKLGHLITSHVDEIVEELGGISQCIHRDPSMHGRYPHHSLPKNSRRQSTLQLLIESIGPVALDSLQFETWPMPVEIETMTIYHPSESTWESAMSQRVFRSDCKRHAQVMYTSLYQFIFCAFPTFF